MKSTCSLMRIMFRTGRRNDCKCWLVFQSICYLLNESKINYFIQCVQYMIQCLFQGLQYRKKTVWEQKLWWLFHWLRKYRPLGEYPENKQRTNIKRVFREKPKRLFFYSGTPPTRSTEGKLKNWACVGTSYITVGWCLLKILSPTIWVVVHFLNRYAIPR